MHVVYVSFAFLYVSHDIRFIIIYTFFLTDGNSFELDQMYVYIALCLFPLLLLLYRKYVLRGLNRYTHTFNI